MKNKHTSGQWESRQSQGNNIYKYKVVSPSIKTICEMEADGVKDIEEVKANAKLIAAVPKMIEFIGKIMGKLQEHQKEDKRIIAGYTLAANIEGFTDLLNEAGEIWRSALLWGE